MLENVLPHVMCQFFSPLFAFNFVVVQQCSLIMMMFAMMVMLMVFQLLYFIFHFRHFALEFLDSDHAVIVNLLLIDIDRSDRSDLSSILRIVENNLEPEPVEDLKAADQGESSEQSKHSSNPAHLVSKTHPSRFGDL